MSLAAGREVRAATVPYATYVVGLFLALSLIGLLNLYSASTQPTYFQVQLKHMGLGLAAFLIVGWGVSCRWINMYAYQLFAVIVASLVVVLALGYSAGGATRWIALGPLRGQPSEFAKLAVVIVVARFFYDHRRVPYYTLRDLFPLLLAIGGVFVLIFKQPDFGTAGLCLLIPAFQIVFVRLRLPLRTLLSLGSVAIAGAISGWAFFLRPYQKMRILTLLDPGKDPTGSGYNSLQSLVAIGSGGAFGKGFEHGTQTQLQFLPARHTDFIFSVFAEEHGFWGSATIFVLFWALILVALAIARSARDSFQALVAIGVAGIVFIEFAINVAMVLGLFPVVGMPLPFFSYGGSASLTICLAMGLLVSIDRDRTTAGGREGRLAHGKSQGAD